MIKVSVTYPSGEGSTFDHDYYSATHVPLCVSTWSPVKSEVESWGESNSRPSGIQRS